MIRRYRVEITADDQGWITAKVPAMPDIHCEAHTREQALSFVRNAVKARLKQRKAEAGAIPDSDVDAIVVDV